MQIFFHLAKSRRLTLQKSWVQFINYRNLILCFSLRLIRGEVLENTIWSPWPWSRRSSPWPRKYPVLGSRTALSFDLLKMDQDHDHFFSSWNTPETLRKNFEDLFFLFWKHLRNVSLVLSLGLKPCVLDSTSAVYRAQLHYNTICSQMKMNKKLPWIILTEVGKAQLEAQSATSATSTIAEVALRFNVLFLNNAEVVLRTKVFKICCALIALRF